MKHPIRVTILIIVITVLAWIWLSFGFDALVPTLASAEGAFVDRLFTMHLYVIAFLFALIMGIMLYSVFAFRRKPGEKGDGVFIHGNTRLEIFWTILPLGTVLFFAALGGNYLMQMTDVEENELVIEVTSSQWSWRFDYPEFDLSSTELYLPRDRPVLLQLYSTDVIHSFWVPEFRVKQDAVPGMMQELRITPTEDGSYKVRCAELCGTEHAYMLATVNVVDETAFQEWVDEQTGAFDDLPPVERGERLAELNGCLACHKLDGTTGVGPTWVGLFGTEEALEDGSSVTVDEDYLRKSILTPGADITQGFADVMPKTFADTLSDQEIDDLIVFIASLGNE